ncbi:ATP-dependent DNA helicase RecQ [Cytospora mali]|uniref:DNA 3'-5' helicase n=1 Tax=Cytospora mali TaxID=578113 RepID=A0A194VL01_CYTMA|nr:ATP-dependent DNA helicase RecQ [Valsa mali]
MSDEFDSGDDLFDDVDVNELLQTSRVPVEQQSHSNSGQVHIQSQKRRSDIETSSAIKRLRPDISPSPEDEENVKLARRLLSEKFGYNQFRHEQEAAIKRILAGKSAFVVFPTGAGKSLCYQIPAIAFPEIDEAHGLRKSGQSGITIIVSPLIALMKDQVDVLKRRGISADCIDSTKTADQLQLINRQLSRGELRMIYCAPERLNNERFVESMKNIPGGVRLVAVDEAHCISEWGHSFRPEYLKVARFVDEIKAERVICLTATATARVAEDVCNAFNIDEQGVFRTSPYRPNLKLFAESVNVSTEKISKLCKFLRENPGPTLVYVTIQKESEDLAERLRYHKFNATAFHAGMKVEAKTQVQDDFMANKVDIVVATIAFGMGVDKADIRNIVHYTLASTVEEYSQQIGRAGRDGNPSNCMFYLCNSDFYIRENFARGDLPSYEPFRKLIRDIFSEDVIKLEPGATFKKETNNQMKEFDIRQSPLSVIYATLELHFNLIRAITPEYSVYSFEQLDTSMYMECMKNMMASDRPEAKAIMEYAEKKVKYTTVNVNEIVRQTGYHRTNIIQILDHLDRDGIIRLTARGIVPKFRVLQKLPNTDEQLEEITQKMYKDLEQKEKDALKRARDVVDLITGEKCFALALAQHFGMDLPDGKEKCGHCTFCYTGKRVQMPPKVKTPLDRDGIARVLKECPVRDDPRFLARVAFGIMSPRVRELKMNFSAAWESMQDQDFDNEQDLEGFTAKWKRTRAIWTGSELMSGPGARPRSFRIGLSQQRIAGCGGDIGRHSSALIGTHRIRNL